MGASKEVINNATESSTDPKWLTWVEPDDQMCLWRERFIDSSALGQSAVAAAAAEIAVTTTDSPLL